MLVLNFFFFSAPPRLRGHFQKVYGTEIFFTIHHNTISTTISTTMSVQMNRRAFLTALPTHLTTEQVNNQPFTATDNPDKPAERAAIQAGVEPFTQPLDRARALHLLRRASFAPTNALVQQLLGKRADEAAELLLGSAPPTDAPPGSLSAWIDQSTENPDGADNDTRDMIRSTWRSQFGALQEWWTQLMVQEQRSVREKMTLFWSGHFTSEFEFDDTFNPPQLLYRQNQTLRRDCLGDVRNLAEDLTLDGAMLNYLGGTLNTKGSPNENYARELLELFTTGIGWYSEGDVREAARALTGWRASRFNDEPRPNGMYATYFDPNRHDTGAKQFLGVTIPARNANENTEFLVRRDEVRRLVDIIFQQRTDAACRFICRKLYAFFVYANPSRTDETFITRLADVMKTNNFQIRPVLKTLFSSAHFFDQANIGVQIKTPAEFTVGLVRQLGVPASSIAATMRSLEQDLIDPPTVAGWDGYRTWISTKTFPLRAQFAQRLISTMSNEAAVAFVRQFPTADNADALMRSIEEFLLPRRISDRRHQAYLQALLGSAPDYEWRSVLRDTTAAGSRIKAALTLILRAPDAHLC